MIFVLLTGFVHLSAGWFIATRVLKPQRLCDVLLDTALVAMTTFYGLPIILGILTSYLNTPTILLSGLTALVAAVVSYRKLTAPQKPFAALVRRFMEFSIFAKFLAGAIFLLIALLLAVGMLLPVRAWDGPGYHIVGPVRWAQSGKFIIDSFGDPFVMPYFGAAETYANVKGILPFLVLLWTESIDGTAIAQWPYLCLLTVALYSLYRRLNLSPTFCFLAIVFCITAPEVILQSVEAYADLAFFATVVAVMTCILRTWQNGSSWHTIFITAMAFAQLAGTKPTAIPASAVLGAGFLFVSFLRPLQPGKTLARLKTSFFALVAVVALSLSIAGVWYFHGLIHLHNPVYPIEVAIGDKVIFEGPYPPSMNADFVTHNTGRSGIEAWWGTITDQWRSPAISSWSGGLGAAAFVIGLPAILIYLLSFPLLPGRKNNLLIIFLFLGLTVTCPAITLARFLLYALALGGLALGVIAQISVRPGRIIISIAALALCAYNVAITFPSILYRARPADLVLYNLFSGNSMPSKTDVYPEEYSALNYWLDFVAGTGKRVAITEVTGIWFFYNPQSKPDMVRIPSKPNETFEEWFERALDAKATHLFIPRASPHFHVAYNSKDKLNVIYDGMYARAQRPEFMYLPLHGALFEILTHD